MTTCDDTYSVPERAESLGKQGRRSKSSPALQPPASLPRGHYASHSTSHITPLNLLAFQAAYYGLYGRVESTYEPAMTKFFLHGRTDAIRTVSDESLRFVQTFWADNPAGPPTPTTVPVIAVSGASGYRSVRVQGGDTLTAIARKFDMSLSELADANKLDPDKPLWQTAITTPTGWASRSARVA